MLSLQNVPAQVLILHNVRQLFAHIVGIHLDGLLFFESGPANDTSSSSFCLASAFFGSFKIRMKSSTESDFSSTRIGHAPSTNRQNGRDCRPHARVRVVIAAGLE